MSKGSKTRPMFISRKKWGENWDCVFGKKTKRREHANWRRRYNRPIGKVVKQ